jgi:uncharacterized protein YndB with AHSA1/START domain
LWRHLVDPRELGRWFADRVRVEEGPPTVFRFETETAEGALLREYAEVVERARPERLVLGFRELDVGWGSATVVSLVVVQSGEDCEVTVVQEGFQRLPLSLGLTAWEHSRSRWTAALARLVEVAGSHRPAAG